MIAGVAMKRSDFNKFKKTLYSPSIDAFVKSMCMADFFDGKEKILAIGDCFGREFDALEGLGKEVHILDLSPQERFKDFARFYQQSICEKTTFPDNYFDGVVMVEVIEHLFEDRAALLEINRILKPDGVLGITVPYFNGNQDFVEHHVRIHSHKTMRRLLESAGFKITQHFYRGFVSQLPMNKLLGVPFLYVPRKILKTFLGSRGLNFFYRFFFNLERFLGKFQWVQKRFSSYGAILKAEKCQLVDYDKIQVRDFSDRTSDFAR